MSALKRNLRIIWDETTNPMSSGGGAGTKRRYIAQAIPGREPGSGGWEVFDKRENRALKNKEIAALSEVELREMWVN